MLTQLLHSIQKQVTKIEYEVVISDNSTDDKIKGVCDRFNTLPIRYVKNPVRGASENINNVIDLASFDKVKLMMQDDLFIHPKAIDLFNSALDSHSWVISNSHHINAIGQRIGNRAAKYEHGNFDSNTVGMPSVVAFRKSDIRFNTELKTFCDVYFYYQLYELYGQPAVIGEYTIAQRFHNASLSRNQKPTHGRDKNYLIRQGLIPGKLPKVVVAVVCYNRYENLDRWMNCWKQCGTDNAELIFIINNDEGKSGFTQYKTSYTDNITVIARPNIGYDIGAFQDACKGRIPFMPTYDLLLWCTDDTIPMSKDFIQHFVDGFGPKVGLTCMQISEEITRHVRTTGFCIPKAIAQKLSFPTDPITTVQQCWQFEHGGSNTLLRQIVKQGLKVIQVEELDKSPLYDMGFWYRNAAARKVAHLHDRMKEHNNTFSNEKSNQLQSM